MASNTTYDPVNKDHFDKNKLNADWKSVSGTATANTTTNIDYTLTDDCCITGLMIILKNQILGDSITLQILTPNDTVINQFGTNCYVPSDVEKVLDIDSQYPAKIPATFKIRLVYTSTHASQNVSVWINYKLHKILV